MLHCRQGWIAAGLDERLQFDHIPFGHLLEGQNTPGLLPAVGSSQQDGIRLGDARGVDEDRLLTDMPSPDVAAGYNRAEPGPSSFHLGLASRRLTSAHHPPAHRRTAAPVGCMRWFGGLGSTYAQFDSLSPLTRWKCFVTLVTTVTPPWSACAAMSVSQVPMASPYATSARSSRRHQRTFSQPERSGRRRAASVYARLKRARLRTGSTEGSIRGVPR